MHSLNCLSILNAISYILKPNENTLNPTNLIGKGIKTNKKHWLVCFSKKHCFLFFKKNIGFNNPACMLMLEVFC